jgi:hypothetical protein
MIFLSVTLYVLSVDKMLRQYLKQLQVLGSTVQKLFLFTVPVTGNEKVRLDPLKIQEL